METMSMVLIVEDEEIEREALKMMVTFSGQKIEKVLGCANGIEALEICQKEHPDLIFMDINLPGISGIEIIRQIKESYDDITFVIVSAYNQFIYAQEGLKLGVYEYLVKPVKNDEIVRILKEVQEIKQKKDRQKLYERDKKIKEIWPVLERDCVMAVTSMRQDIPIDTMLEFMQMELKSAFVFTVSGAKDKKALIQRVRKSTQDMGMTCFAEYTGGIGTFVVLSAQSMIWERVSDAIHHIQFIMKISGENIHIGVGNCVDHVNNLSFSYKEAMTALRMAKNNGDTIVFYEAIMDRIPDYVQARNEAELKENVMNAIRCVDRIKITELLQEYIAEIQMNCTIQEQKQRMYQFYISVLSSFQKENHDLETVNIHDFMESEEVHNLFIKCILRIEEVIENQSMQLNGKTAELVVQYMKNHYMDKITLDDLAERFDLSVFYLSRLLKKYTGVTFTEYIALCRVEKAKEMLKEGKYSIKEISYMVGFSSQGYFAKVFHKYTGKSPSDFIKKS